MAEFVPHDGPYEVLEVLTFLPQFGAHPGDLLISRPEHPTHPLQLVRALPKGSALPRQALRPVLHSAEKPQPQRKRKSRRKGSGGQVIDLNRWKARRAGQEA